MGSSGKLWMPEKDGGLSMVFPDGIDASDNGTYLSSVTSIMCKAYCDQTLNCGAYMSSGSNWGPGKCRLLKKSDLLNCNTIMAASNSTWNTYLNN